MQRVVVFGRGGAGKSTLCRRVGEITGLPVVELDAIYWDGNLAVLTPEEWRRRQADALQDDAWIADGDLGPYDVTAPRLTRADTVVILDTPLVTCLWRALRRGRQRMDFWLWVLRWRRTYRPRIFADLRRWAPDSAVVILRRRSDIHRWLAGLSDAPR